MSATRVERPAPADDVQAVAERRRAARHLLRHPLITQSGPHSDELRLIRRHRAELTRLFAEGLGYRLVVEPHAARLLKAGLGRDAAKPLRKRSGAPFTPRAYALLCLTLAALTRCRSQLLVDELVAQVRSAAADAGLDVDLDAGPDRRALHAVLTHLVGIGVLHERDGDLEHWADQHAQSLLDVRQELLPLLVSAPLSSAAAPDDLLTASALPSAAGGARVAVRRRLIERPVLSVEDLPDDQAEWWRRNRNREREWFADRFGLELELRAEGAAVLDPDDWLTDDDFPGRGSTKHLALLLLAELTAHARTATGRPGSPWREVCADVVVTARDAVLGRWREGLRRDHREEPEKATDGAIDVLVSFGLVRRGDGGSVLVHAAAARYAVRTTLTDASASGEASLFDLADDEKDGPS